MGVNPCDSIVSSTLITHISNVRSQSLIVYILQGTHSNCIFKFPVFSLFDGK